MSSARLWIQNRRRHFEQSAATGARLSSARLHWQLLCNCLPFVRCLLLGRTLVCSAALSSSAVRFATAVCSAVLVCWQKSSVRMNTVVCSNAVVCYPTNLTHIPKSSAWQKLSALLKCLLVYWSRLLSFCPLLFHCAWSVSINRYRLLLVLCLAMLHIHYRVFRILSQMQAYYDAALLC